MCVDQWLCITSILPVFICVQVYKYMYIHVHVHVHTLAHYNNSCIVRPKAYLLLSHTCSYVVALFDNSFMHNHVCTALYVLEISCPRGTRKTPVMIYVCLHDSVMYVVFLSLSFGILYKWLF